MIEEKWVPVIDWEDFFEISNLGNVRSLPRRWFSGRNKLIVHSHNGRMLKTFISNKGYLRVQLCAGGKSKQKTIHRLVWESFNGKTDLQVDHIKEGDKTNNKLDNLQVLTNKQNVTKYYLSVKS